MPCVNGLSAPADGKPVTREWPKTLREWSKGYSISVYLYVKIIMKITMAHVFKGVRDEPQDSRL